MDVDEDDLLKHATTLTNKQRGNEVTVRPATLDGEYPAGFFVTPIFLYVWMNKNDYFLQQLCLYTSWQLRGMYHKWLHTWIKVSDEIQVGFRIQV